MTPLRLEPTALRSRVKSSTIEPLCSQSYVGICNQTCSIHELFACYWQLLSSADNQWKQFWSRSAQQSTRTWSGSTLMLFLKDFFEESQLGKAMHWTSLSISRNDQALLKSYQQRTLSGRVKITTVSFYIILYIEDLTWMLMFYWIY